MTEIERMLLESNDLLRSAKSIADRRGADTNWKLWASSLSAALRDQRDVTNDIRHRKQFAETTECLAELDKSE